MWKQAPSSAAACSFWSRRSGTHDGDFFHCDTAKTSAFFSSVHHATICLPSIGCHAIAQLRINPVASNILHLVKSPACRLNRRENAKAEDGEICCFSRTLAQLTGACISSHCQRPKTRSRSWKIYWNEPAETEDIVILPTVNQSRANSRCLTTPESRQIADMQTDSSSLVDLNCNRQIPGRVANAHGTTRVQNTHFMNYYYWSQPKKRKVHRSFGSDQESALLSVGFSRLAPGGSSADECLTTKQALDLHNYYKLSTKPECSQKNSAASDLTSEQQLHMADQEDSSSSSVDEIAAPLNTGSRGSSPSVPPEKKPREQFDPVQEPQELLASSAQSLPSPTPEECVTTAYTRSVPPANTDPSSQLEIESTSPRLTDGPEREFYPQTTVVPLALDRLQKKISNPEESLYDHAHLRLPSLRPEHNANVNEEAGPSWLQLRLGTTLKDSGSGEATTVHEEPPGVTWSFKYRPEASSSRIALLPSSDPTETIGGRQDHPCNPSPSNSSLDPAHSRDQLLPAVCSGSFQLPQLQDRGAFAQRPEFETSCDVPPELDPSEGFAQVLLPPRCDQLQAPANLFPQGAASRTSRQQAHGANSICPSVHDHREGMVPLRHDDPRGARQLVQFMRDSSTAHQIPAPFPGRPGDARQLPAGAGHISSSKGEGPSQPRIHAQLFRPSTSAPSQPPPRFQSEESFLTSWMMMQSGGAGPSMDSFCRPGRSDHRRPGLPLEQSTFRLAPWLHEIGPASTSARGVLGDWRGVSNMTALESVHQRGQILQSPWHRLLDRVGQANYVQLPRDRPLQQPAAAAVGSQDIYMAAVRRASQFHNSSSPGSPTSLQPLSTRLEATGVIGVRGAAAAASSSRHEQSSDPQLQQQTRSRSATVQIHDHLPASSSHGQLYQSAGATAAHGGGTSFLSLTPGPWSRSSNRSSATAGEAAGSGPPVQQLPSVEATVTAGSSAERDFLAGLRSSSTSASLQPSTNYHHSYHTAGLWFRLKAADMNQNGFPTLDQVPKAYLHVNDENVTVSVVRKYLVEKLGLENESEVQISCNGFTLQPMLSLQYVRENIWQPRAIETSSVHLRPSSSSEPDGSTRIEDLEDSSLSLEDVVMVLHYSRTHQI